MIYKKYIDNFKSNDRQQVVASPIEPVVMCAFLAQFKPENNWAVLVKDLNNKEIIDLAKDNGLIANWIPPKGSTYHKTLLCTLKGRLYIRKNT